MAVVTQRSRHVADLVVLRRQQMSAAQDQMHRLVERALSRLDNLFDCGMAASDNEDYSIGCVDRQRDFLHFQVDAPSAVQQDDMETRRYFGRLADPREIPFGPWAAETKRLRWPAVEVPHIRRKRLVAPVETAG